MSNLNSMLHIERPVHKCCRWVHNLVDGDPEQCVNTKGTVRLDLIKRVLALVNDLIL